MAELTAEMVADLLRPREVAVSPDGRWVAFGVEPASRREEHAQGAIWLAPTDGSAPARQVTAGLAHDRAPRWSPDGAAIYFLSDRKEREKAQLHRLPLAGGEAEALTDWPAGIAAFAPLPDGRRVALLAEEPKSEDEERREKERDDAQVFGADFPRRSQRLRLLDLASGALGAPVDLGGRHAAEVVPDPSGETLAVLTWATPELDYGSCRSAVFLVKSATGAARKLADLPTGGEALTWRRGGAALCYIADSQGDRASGNALFALDLDGGAPRTLTLDLPACPMGVVGAVAAEPLVVVARGLDCELHRLEAGDGLTRLAGWRGDVSSLAQCNDGAVVAFVADESAAPPGVWAGPPAGPHRCLSDLNPALRQVAWGSQERLAWTAADGLALDGLLILPPGTTRADGPFPTITVVHGGPYARFADSFQLHGHVSGQWLALAGFAVFCPNPRGGQGHGVAFARMVKGAVGLDDWRDIVAGLDRLVAEGVADPNRLGIGGWSQGGFMTAWAIGQSDRFRAAVMGAGVSDWGMMVAESDVPTFEAALGGSTGWEGPGPHRHDALSPISFVGRVTTPVLILHGERDERVPASQARFFARALRALGKEHELVVYPREPHGIRERNHQLDLLRRTRAWFGRVLDG